MTYREFEEKIAWIIKLLEKSGAEVKANEKILDPDNPKQKRQIDVLIKRNNFITLVECRLHNKPQNVKWIEELYGRRISLNAYSVIAVSASGFTKGAINKAERLGIILRDYMSLSKKEIDNWGKASSLYLEYISFFETILYFVIEPQIIKRKILDLPMIETPNGKNWPIDSLFKKAISEIGKSKRTNGGGIRIQVFTKQLLYRGSQINEVIFQSNYRLNRLPSELPVVYIYSEPNSTEKPEMYVEGQEGSKFEIYRHEKFFSVVVDLSIIKPIDGAIFKSILFDLKEPLSLHSVKFIGQDKDSFYKIPFEIIEIPRDSKKYSDLVESLDEN